MTTRSLGSLQKHKLLFVCLLGLMVLLVGYAASRKTSGTIPLEAKRWKNPLVPSAENLDAARKNYADRCANCHGLSGKGDGTDAMMYDPAPSDLTDASKMSPKTDGELFYQISEGRKPMPSFKSRLSEQQRWQLVLLVRSFSSPPAAAPFAPNPNLGTDAQPAPASSHR